MAVEKLILRSIYYAVDKIPDTWFHAVPGGYYRSKTTGEIKKIRGRSRSLDKEGRGRRRHTSRAAHEDDYHNEPYRSSRKGQRCSRERRSYDDEDERTDEECDQYYKDRSRRGRSKSRNASRSRVQDHHAPVHPSRPRSHYDNSRAQHYDNSRAQHYGGARPGHGEDDSSWTYSRTIYRRPEAPPLDPPPLGGYPAQPLNKGNGDTAQRGTYRNRGRPLPRSQTFAGNLGSDSQHPYHSSPRTTVSQDTQGRRSTSDYDRQHSARYGKAAPASRDDAMFDDQAQPSKLWWQTNSDSVADCSINSPRYRCTGCEV